MNGEAAADNRHLRLHHHLYHPHLTGWGAVGGRRRGTRGAHVRWAPSHLAMASPLPAAAARAGPVPASRGPGADTEVD